MLRSKGELITMVELCTKMQASYVEADSPSGEKSFYSSFIFGITIKTKANDSLNLAKLNYIHFSFSSLFNKSVLLWTKNKQTNVSVFINLILPDSTPPKAWLVMIPRGRDKAAISIVLVFSHPALKAQIKRKCILQIASWTKAPNYAAADACVCFWWMAADADHRH